MNRIEKTIKAKGEEKILSVFFTAGHPTLNSVIPICSMLQKAGVDMIEIGFPCSDPLADGPLIQQSSGIALKNGMCLSSLFNQLMQFRKEISIPVLLMGYYNQVLQFGEEKFLNACLETGLDGFIIPDLPQTSVLNKMAVEHQMANVKLVCPTTSQERIVEIDKNSTGFLYAVSSSATTGSGSSMNEAFLEKLSTLNISNKIITGFGIKTGHDFKRATEFTSGGIVGSAFVDFLNNPENINQERIQNFIHQLKNI